VQVRAADAAAQDVEKQLALRWCRGGLVDDFELGVGARDCLHGPSLGNARARAVTIGGMTDDGPLTDAELDAMQRRADAASQGPWKSWIEGRDQESGSTFIQIGGDDDRDEDMYVDRDDTPTSDADLDFIAAARQDIPRLIAEVRRLRAELDRA
jgi:hypothetical protein